MHIHTIRTYINACVSTYIDKNQVPVMGNPLSGVTKTKTSSSMHLDAVAGAWNYRLVAMSPYHDLMLVIVIINSLLLVTVMIIFFSVNCCALPSSPCCACRQK